MLKISSVIVMCLIAFTVFADVPPEQQKEVSHLLSFVESSQCVVNRNGSEHDGKSAAKHMRKKYKYFKDDIASTEDFIRLSATKSTMSGKYYKVSCPNQSEMKTQQWLLEELKAFRQS